MWLWLYRLALWFLPFRWVAPRSPAHKSPAHRSSTHRSPRATAQISATPRQLARTIDRAARFVPHATCLVRALAGAQFFARAGQQVSIVIGVRRKGDALEAHAWLEVSGTVVLGSVQDLHGYHPLG
jgi:hypothetical protein